MKKQKLITISLIAIFILMALPPLGTAYLTTDTYSSSNIDNYQSLSNSGINTWIGEAIHGSGGKLHSITFYYAREAGVSYANLQGEIYLATGTLGTNAVGTGNSLAVSTNTQQLNTTHTANQYYPFTFYFTDTITLESNQNYIVGVNVTSRSGEYVKRGIDMSSPSFYGNGVIRQTDGVWSGSATWDCAFSVDTTDPNAPTPTPIPIPDGYFTATFGISPSDGGNILWETQSTLNEDGDSLGVGGEVGTYQLQNGTKVSAFAQVNAEYVFDHWEASTGEYTFYPEVNPIKFTGTNNFNLTAVLEFANETDCVRIDMPVTSHGHIDITYTIEGFTNTFGNYRFLYVKPGTNLTITPDPDNGYIHAQTLITPDDPAEYYSDLTQMFISDSLAWTVNYNCTIEGTFTLPAGSTPSTFEEAVLPYLNLLMPVIILAVSSLLGYKYARAWGFFAGVNIGAIITYMVLPTVFPLWGIIALLIIDGLLLFGKVGIRS